MPNAPRPDNPARAVRIENELWARVQAVAVIEDATPSEVVREGVQQYVEQVERRERR